jgi:hypothetical protein
MSYTIDMFLLSKGQMFNKTIVSMSYYPIIDQTLAIADKNQLIFDDVDSTLTRNYIVIAF